MMYSNGIVLWAGILAAVLHQSQARCNNWCNRRGICSDPGDSGYCTCEIGYGGDDCAYQLCPRAFDPLTLAEHPGRKTIRVTTALAAGSLSGHFTFEFFGSTIDVAASMTGFNAGLCSQSFSALQAVDKATCELERANEDGSGSYLVRFHSWSVGLYENNLYSHDGRPSVTNMHCEPTLSASESATDPRCSVQDADSGGNIPEYAVCASHGSCDRTTGQCNCERGFHGAACDDTSDSADIVYHLHDGPYFTGNMLKAKALRTASPDFNLFQLARANSMGEREEVVTTVRGDGLLTHRGAVAATGPVTVAALFPAAQPGEMQLEGGDPRSALSLDGRLSADQEKRRHVFQEAEALLHTAAGSADQHHIRSSLDGADVFSVSAAGRVEAAALSTLDGSFRAGGGLLRTQDVVVEASLTVGGAAHVEDSLTLGSGFVLNPEGMTIDASTHGHALLELKSGAVDFDGALLEIQGRGSQSSFIKGTVDGVTTFDLAASGNLTLKHIRLESGGVHVSAGGVQVEAGGVTVHGGLTVASGGVSFADSALEVSGVNARRPAGSTDGSALLSASIDSDRFSGSVVELTGMSAGVDQAYDFIRATSLESADAAAGEDVFTVSNRGSVVARGGLSVGGALQAAAGAVLGADLTLTKTPVSAGEVIVIPNNIAYVEIFDDKKVAVNRLTFPCTDSAAGVRVEAGRVLIVTNSDAQATTGDAAIPAASTVLLVSDGEKFVPVDALRAPMSVLEGVRSLRAAADLDIGNHTFTAAAFSLGPGQTAVPRNALVTVGANGVIKGTTGLSYSKGTLSVPALSADTLSGDVDVRYHSLEHAVLPNAVLRNATVQAHDISMTTKGSGLAFFDSEGRLQAAASVKLSETGRPVFDQMDTDLDMKGHKLTNTVLINSVLENIVNASVFNLKLTPYSSNAYAEDSIAVFVGGYVRSTGKGVSLSKSGDLKVRSIDQFAMNGDISGSGHTISDVTISGGSIVHDAASVSTKSLRITSLQTSADDSKAHRVLVATRDGGVTTMSDGDSASGLRLSRVTVSSSLTLGGPLTMSPEHDLTAGNIYSPKGSFEAVDVSGALKFSGGALADISKVNKVAVSRKILTVDGATGAIGSAGGVRLSADNVLTFEHSRIDAAAVSTGKLAVESLGTPVEAAVASMVLSARKDGEVFGSQQLSVSSLTSTGDLTVGEAATVGELVVRNLAPGGVVTANGAGALSVATDIKVDSVQADSAWVSDLGVKNLRIGDGSGETGVATVDKAGRVGVSRSLSVDKVEAGAVLMSSADVDGALTLRGLAAGKGESNLLRVDSSGVVSSSQEASFISLDAVTVSASESAVLGALTVSSLQHPEGEVDHVVIADKAGTVSGASRVSISQLTADDVTATKSFTAESVRITGLVSSATGLPSLLMLQADGQVATSDVFAVKSVEAGTIRSTEALEVGGSLKLSKLSSGGVLKAGADGTVAASSDVSVVTVSTQSLTVSQQSTTGSLVISELASGQSSLLSVDSSGKVQTAKDLSVASAFVSGTVSAQNVDVSGKLTIRRAAQAQGGAAAGQLLFLDETGTVNRASNIEVGHIGAVSSSVTGKATFDGPVVFSSLPPGVISVEEGGSISSSKDITLPEGGSMFAPAAEVTDKLLLRGDVVLRNAKYDVATSVADIASMPVVPVGIDRSTNTLEVMTSLLGFEGISAQRISASGVVTASGLRLDSINSHGKTAVLTVGSDGEVSATTDLTATSVAAAAVDVDGPLSASTARLDSLRSAPVGSLLCTQEDGFIAPVDASAVLQTASVKVSGDLTVSGRLLVADVVLSGSAPGVAVVDGAGVLSTATDLDVSTLNVVKKSSLTDVKITGSLSLPGAAAAGKKLSGILSVDRDRHGEVVLASDITLNSIHANDATVTGRTTLQKLVLGDSTDSNSGFLVVSAGEVGVSKELTVQQVTASRATVSEIRASDNKGVAVVDAQLSGKTVIGEGATIWKASSVETNMLSVLSGPTNFGGAVDIEGNLDVRGHVMGSGPYHDSSDKRFKTNITTVHGALAKLKEMKAVTYEYRVEDFPGKGLPTGPQIGWIAQDVQQVLPELVATDTDGFMYVSYAHAAPVIAEAVVELHRELDVLRAEGTASCDCSEKMEHVSQELKETVAELAAVQAEASELRARMARMEEMMQTFVK